MTIFTENVDLKKFLNKIIDIFERDYMQEKIIGNFVQQHRIYECSSCFEVRYKDIDIYFYNKGMNIYIDDFFIDIYDHQDLFEFFNANKLEKTKEGITIRNIEYINRNFDYLSSLIIMTL